MSITSPDPSIRNFLRKRIQIPPLNYQLLKKSFGLIKNIREIFFSVSDPDPDPCGSVLKWLPWIQIQIFISVSDPDPDSCGSLLKWLPWIQIQDCQNDVHKGKKF